MKRWIVLFLAATLAAGAFGCARTAKIAFQAEKQINDGLLVPVDVIATNQEKSKPILEIGPDEWFASKMRESMSDAEVVHLALRGGETRKIKFKGPKGTDTFIIYADFQGVTERDRQQVVYHPKGGLLVIELREKKLHVQDGGGE